MRIRSESAFCARPAAFGFFLLFTIVLTWPFAIRLDTAASDLGDPLLNTWILDWDLYSITNAPTHIYDANIFYPSKVPAGVQREPLRHRHRRAAVLLLRLHAADGLQHRLPPRLRLLRLRRVRSRPRADALDGGGLVAGILYSFVNFRTDHLAHLQFVWGGWMPMMLAALLHYWRRPTTRNAVLLGSAC